MDDILSPVHIDKDMQDNEPYYDLLKKKQRGRISARTILNQDLPHIHSEFR